MEGHWTEMIPGIRPNKNLKNKEKEKTSFNIMKHNRKMINMNVHLYPRLRIVPAVVGEESVDKVTAVLAAAAAESSVGMMQVAPVDADCVLAAAADETVPAVAVRGVVEDPVWVLDSWIGLVIQV